MSTSSSTWERDESEAPGEYDNAVRLLIDLPALAERDDRPDEFARRCGAIRRDHARKTTLIDRLNRVNL